MNKKGFSLVELIIVIAIMAILVGLMAPQLLKYVEKTKVSSDIQLADTIHSALYYSITDARVISDPASQDYLAALESPAGMKIDDPTTPAWDHTSVLEDSLRTAISEDFPRLAGMVKSKHDNQTKIMAYTADNKVIVVIEHTDKTGKGDITDPDNWITVD